VTVRRNVAILTPIAAPTVFRLFPTDQGRFAESAGWRVLVGALWSAIPVLSLQLIYKTVWLGRLRRAAGSAR